MQFKFLICCLLFVFLNACRNDNQNTQTKTGGDPSEKPIYLNHSDTAHYVGMQQCRLCHQKIYDSFLRTGMGSSFDHATRKKSAADFSRAAIYDSFSNFHYKAFWNHSDSLFILEYRMEGKDTTYQRREKIDYIIGSGQHTNSHLQFQNGFLTQAPMTYYTQSKRWDLPPGFEGGVNTRFSRKIGLECISCHNALPDFVAGSENRFNSLPTGINCERCHGPGSIHVQERSKGTKVDTAREIDFTIVNPAKLPIDLQFDVCMRCHLQGNTILRNEKSFSDFRPGMKLKNFMDVFLPKYENAEEEFIMASHADRLKMSKCFQYGIKNATQKKDLKPYKNALTCVSCHNPHLSVKETGKEVFNQTCLNCHGKSVEKNCSEKSVKKILANGIHQSDLTEKANCVSCHLPVSGSIDIPHVRIHDHFIRKPITKKESSAIKTFLGLFAINDESPDSLTKASAYLNQYEKFEKKTYYLDSAEKYLYSKNRKTLFRNLDALIQLYFLKESFATIQLLVNDIGLNQLLQTRLNKASLDNKNAWSCYRIGESLTQLKKDKEALAFFEQAAKLAPYVPEFLDKLAVSNAKADDKNKAHQYFEICIQQNPKFAASLSNLGFLFLTEGNVKAAGKMYAQALRLSPDNTEILLNLAGLYNFTGDNKAALHTLKRVIQLDPGNKKANQILESLKGQNTHSH